MARAGEFGRAALGFCVHTGWAAMISIAGPVVSPMILERRRVEMIAGSDPESPPFVYHAARKLPLRGAERFIREAAELSLSKALAALEVAVAELGKRHYEVVASGIIVGDRPLQATLETILKSHSLIHAAEGELFRVAVKRASQALRVPVCEIRARDLRSRAAELLGMSPSEVPQRLASIGRSAGRPWAKDQKDSLLAALLASFDND
jgi:hypothetical protein